MIRAILFDLDDTLLNQKDASTAGLKIFHQTHCANLKWEIVRDRWENCLQTHYEKYVRGEITFQQQRRCRIRDIFENPGLDDESADRLFSTYLSAYEREYQLFPDVRAFLDENMDVLFGVITNGETAQQKDKLMRMGISHYFDAIIISEEAGLRKPNTEIFRLAAQKLNVHPSECLFIGDNLEADYMGSNEAGMHAVLIERHKKATVQGIRTISSLAEIQSIIDVIS